MRIIRGMRALRNFTTNRCYHLIGRMYVSHEEDEGDRASAQF